jgi:hypothetical protein
MLLTGRWIIVHSNQKEKTYFGLPVHKRIRLEERYGNTPNHMSMKFTALEELFVFVDRQFFEDWVKEKGESPDVNLGFPTLIARNLWNARWTYQELHGSCSFEVPRVNVKWGHAMIVHREIVELETLNSRRSNSEDTSSSDG